MYSKKSLTINFIMNTFLTISSFIFPLISFPYVSRILLPVGTGRVSFATSVISYFSILAQLGIPTYGIRACARVRNNKSELTVTVHELFLINLITSIFSYIAFFIALCTVPKLMQDRILFLIISSTIFFNLIGMEWLYKALELYTYITIRSIIFKFIALVAMFFLIHEQRDYVCYGAITIFAASASNILNFFNIHKLIGRKSSQLYNLSRHIKPVFVFFAMSCATTVYTNLDTVMLGFMRSDTEVGLYNAAVKVKAILLGIVTSLGTVLLPRVSYYLENAMVKEFQKIAEKSLHFVLLLAGPLCIYFILFAKESILFLSGNEYFGAILPMQIIMPTLVMIGLTNIMGIQMLVPMGKETLVLCSEVAGAVVDLILNAIFIPIYGAVGAALGTLIAEVAVWFVQFYFLRMEIKGFYKRFHYGILISAVSTGAIASVWVKRMEWSPFVTLTISSIIYFSSYLLVLFLTKETLVVEILHNISNKINKYHLKYQTVKKNNREL